MIEKNRCLDLIMLDIEKTRCIQETILVYDTEINKQVDISIVDYIDEDFIEWFNLASSVDETRVFSYKHLKDVFNRLWNDNVYIGDAIALAVEKYGSEVSGYVDSSDLDRSDNSSFLQDVRDKGLDLAMSEDNDLDMNWGDETDYYSDYMSSIEEHMSLFNMEEMYSELEDDISESIKQGVDVYYDYSGIGDETVVKMSVAMVLPYGDSWGEMQCWNFSKSGKIKNFNGCPVEQVFKVLGTTSKKFKKWYNNSVQDGFNNIGREDYFSKYSKGDGRHSIEAKKDELHYSIFEAWENSAYGFNELAFLVNISLSDREKLMNAKSITFPRSTFAGFHESCQGSGYMGGLKVDGITLDLTKNLWVFQMENAYNGYSVDDVSGLTGECWNNDFIIGEPKDEKDND